MSKLAALGSQLNGQLKELKSARALVINELKSLERQMTRDSNDHQEWKTGNAVLAVGAVGALFLGPISAAGMGIAAGVSNYRQSSQESASQSSHRTTMDSLVKTDEAAVKRVQASMHELQVYFAGKTAEQVKDEITAVENTAVRQMLAYGHMGYLKAQGFAAGVAGAQGCAMGLNVVKGFYNGIVATSEAVEIVEGSMRLHTGGSQLAAYMFEAGSVGKSVGSVTNAAKGASGTASAAKGAAAGSAGASALFIGLSVAVAAMAIVDAASHGESDVHTKVKELITTLEQKQKAM